VSLRFPHVLPSWQYADPALFAQFTSRPMVRVVIVPANDSPAVRCVRDRYYTQAKRLHVKQLMRGKR